MTKSNRVFEAKVEYFKAYCKTKNYQCEPKQEANNIALFISNIKEKTKVNIYFTGSIHVQGSNNKLHEEMDGLKDNIPAEALNVEEGNNDKSTVTKYEIVSGELKGKIKTALSHINATTEECKVVSHVEYKLKLMRGPLALTLTQYKNGTLLLQGKMDNLHDEICDLIEQTAHPSEEYVIARFISNNEDNLKTLSIKYTPELLSTAESNIKTKLGKAYNYCKSHDQKYLVAAECLCLTDIPLPEFSPLVMPASKAFEGFLKRLLVEIGLFAPDHFNKKEATFALLGDKKNPKYLAVADKDKYIGHWFDKIKVLQDENRNFMLHSDDNAITKVNTVEEAKRRVNKIYEDINEIFGYFSSIFKLTV